MPIGVYRRPPVYVRFWKFVTELPTEGCWEWRGARLVSGYGIIRDRGARLRAHRVAWEMHYGPIPPGMQVCHRCDNPPCVRPDHLFLGTNEDNMADMRLKHRAATPPVHRGQDNPNARLNQHSVRAIRRAVARGESMYSVAKRYPVSKQTIISVVKRRTWAHVQ